MTLRTDQDRSQVCPDSQLASMLSPGEQMLAAENLQQVLAILTEWDEEERKNSDPSTC